MTNNQQLAYRLIQQEHIKRLGTDELALLRNRPQQKPIVINPIAKNSFIH